MKNNPYVIEDLLIRVMDKDVFERWLVLKEYSGEHILNTARYFSGNNSLKLPDAATFLLTCKVEITVTERKEEGNEIKN